ncbi:hypothetical protein ICN48_13650, partial [Polynucleobacter sp. JS-Safj-400b-B2]|nr:hypothetical protein [Polynucleobacter sp. JS-Safj-400b-B2]
QIQSLTSTEVAGLSATQLGYKDASGHTVLTDLTATQIAALTSIQIAALTTAQIQSLTSTEVAGLSAPQLGCKDASGNSVLADLTATQIAALTSTPLTSTQIAGLSSTQLGSQAITSELVQAMSLTYSSPASAQIITNASNVLTQYNSFLAAH